VDEEFDWEESLAVDVAVAVAVVVVTPYWLVMALLVEEEDISLVHVAVVVVVDRLV
jgi:hypothetical protein